MKGIDARVHDGARTDVSLLLIQCAVCSLKHAEAKLVAQTNPVSICAALQILIRVKIHDTDKAEEWTAK